MEKATLEAPDISCEHCIQSIQKALNRLPGAQFLEGDPESRHVTVQYDPSSVTIERIQEAMEEEGYPVKK